MVFGDATAVLDHAVIEAEGDGAPAGGVNGVLTRLRYQDPVDAITGAADDIRSRAEVTSLNCLLLTDGALCAYAEADPDSEVSRRFCRS